MTVERTILSSDNFILYALMPGKPDPNIEKPIGKDTRPRVFAKGNASHCCFNYAVNMIRDRIGNVSNGFEDQRIIELQCANWHKEVEKTCEYQANNPEIYFKSIEKVHKKTLEIFKKDPEKLVESFWKNMTRDALMHDPIIRQNGKCGEIDNMLESLFPMIQQQTEKIKPYVKAQFLDVCTKMEVSTQLGLARSTWVPGKGVGGLLETLKEHGPMIVMGNLGASYYKEAPFKLSEKINGYTISGWKPGSTRINPCISHAVVLVGAQSNPDRVYFVDPNDSSIPNEPRPIYVNSYKVFNENLLSLAGIPTTEAIHSETIGYTLFNPLIKEDL